MDTQLDAITIRGILVPLKKNLLRLLKKKILSRKNEHWPTTTPGLLPCQAYYHACKTVLDYFHFAAGGAAPLSLLEWSGKERSTVDGHQTKYMRDIKDQVSRQDAQLRGLKDGPMYETEMYWCHQLLFAGWKADMPHAGKFLEFTEKDFLVT
ncbi:hypothetical protein B0T26DRAFT_638620 [Lasiosphaeria miniovina]|uniref:Uncharacterized protein n=1 Tax=Lasiosphaeria miniovina TaxID=1954250 RepID=A0AA40E8X0_9PEZI|nr:uncharacterized protein B0T26DRAFT_638620 [Lasiosphaeria miniovina]KAK0728331.1 hypothetical protein B0T26DRAFT_638620 [Lasiosphaeria miniovina]